MDRMDHRRRKLLVANITCKNIFRNRTSNRRGKKKTIKSSKHKIRPIVWNNNNNNSRILELTSHHYHIITIITNSNITHENKHLGKNWGENMN